MNSISFLFGVAILFFIQPGSSTWTEPQKLSSPDRECNFPEMYIDPVTRITHTLWIDNYGTDFRLAYSKVYPDRTTSDTVFLETVHRPRLSHIIGEGDGKHILIAYDAKRGQGDRHDCSASDPLGCYEIFFIESFDGGNTWSKAVMIDHEEVNDARDRKGPRIIYIKENKQTYITYWRSGPMAYTTRYGNGEFTKEAVMPFGSTTAYQSIIYTVDKVTKKPKLHFIYVNWSYPIEHMMYTSSLDEGKNWRSPKELVTYIHKSPSDSYFRPYAVANSELIPDTLFVAFILHNEVHLMWSNDDGNAWSRILPTHRGSAVAPRIQLCRGSKNQKPRIHVLYGMRKAFNHNSFVFGTLDTQGYTYKEEEFPFHGMYFNWAYLVDCYVDENDNEIAAALVETFDEDFNSIFISYNDDLKGITFTDAIN